MKAKRSERKCRILEFLVSNPGATRGEIEAEMGVSVGATIARMLGQRLIDGRPKILKPSGGRGRPPVWESTYYLTEKGRSRLEFLIT